jgi:hypothetical protein
MRKASFTHEICLMLKKKSSVQLVPRALSPAVKRQGRETDHLPPPSAEVKNSGAVPPLPDMSSWHSA